MRGFLSLLAGYLYHSPNQDVCEWRKLPHRDNQDTAEGHAQRILSAWEARLGENSSEIQIMRILGIFDRPATDSELNSVIQEKIDGLNDRIPAPFTREWHSLLSRLRSCELIAPSRDEGRRDGAIDVHPIVRAYFSATLSTRANLWKAANHAFFIYLVSGTTTLAQTLEERLHVYRTIRHASAADKFEDASEMYVKCIRDNKPYFQKDYRILAADLDCLACFFDVPWHVFPASLRTWESWRTFVLSEVSLALYALGSLKDAIGVAQWAFDIAHFRLRRTEAATIAEHLSTFYLTLGDLRAAEDAATASISLAESGGDSFRLISSQVALAHVMHAKGQLEESEKIHVIARENWLRSHRNGSVIGGFRSYYYGDILLDLGKIEEALSLAQTVITASSKMATEHAGDIDSAMERLLLGRAIFASGEIDRAQSEVEKAVEQILNVGRKDMIALGLIERAKIRLELNQKSCALQDLRRAKVISEKGEMRLLQVSYAIEMAKLLLRDDDRDAAICLLESGRALAGQVGYLRGVKDIDRMAVELRR